MSKQHKGMRPQDVMVLVKLALNTNDWTAKQLGHSIGLSKSEICDSLDRSMLAGLLDDSKRLVKRQRLVEFLLHGVGYVFPALVDETPTRGIPTASSVKPLTNKIVSDQDLVWADETGTAVGWAVTPLYKTVPQAARQDERLHSVLALVDVLRLDSSRVRERNLAKELLEDVLLNRNEQVFQA